jgi:hypothetical protein
MPTRRVLSSAFGTRSDNCRTSAPTPCWRATRIGGWMVAQCRQGGLIVNRLLSQRAQPVRQRSIGDQARPATRAGIQWSPAAWMRQAAGLEESDLRIVTSDHAEVRMMVKRQVHSLTCPKGVQAGALGALGDRPRCVVVVNQECQAGLRKDLVRSCRNEGPDGSICCHGLLRTARVPRAPAPHFCSHLRSAFDCTCRAKNVHLSLKQVLCLSVDLMARPAVAMVATGWPRHRCPKRSQVPQDVAAAPDPRF